MHVGLDVSEQNDISPNKAVEMWWYWVTFSMKDELMQNRLTPGFGVAYWKQSKFSLAI